MRLRTFFLSSVFLSALTILVVTGSPDQDKANITPRPAQAQAPYIKNMSTTWSGSYLAGRFAQQQKDWENAYQFMSQALDKAPPGHESDLLDRTFLLALGNNSIEAAENLSTPIIEQGKNKELAYILKAVSAANNGDYSTTFDHLQQIDTGSFGAYTVPLLRAWAALGAGNAEQAITILTEAQYADDPHYLLHTALIHDVNGNKDDAEVAYQEAFRQGLTSDETLLIANFFERHGKISEAEDIYETVQSNGPGSIFSVSHNQISENNMLTPAIANAEDGLAFALFAMSNLLYERNAFESALIYGRLVAVLQPQNGPANIMLGDLLTMNNRFEDALKHYNQIPDSSPSARLAHLRSAEVMEASGQTDQALDLLNSLSKQETTRLEALTHLGNLHQRSEEYGLAVKAYEQAIQTLGNKVNESHWHLYYARGTTYERLGNWKAAEKDLLQALAYQPENPAVLNYLGYSWVDKDINLDQAIKLIRKAVELRPNDGFIADSYGWAYYKQGEYDKSVYWLERAVKLNPEDATLNDHLGDAYWQTGRLQEARFQWERAIRYARDPDKKTALRTKLKYGLLSVPEINDINQEAALR